MGLEPKSTSRARQILALPNGAMVLQERVWFERENRYLKSDDVREAVLLISPEPDRDEAMAYGFRPQGAIFDTLQHGNGWDVDSVAYNFSYNIPPDMFWDRGRAYRAEILLVLLGADEDIPSFEIRLTYNLQVASGLW